MKAGDSDMYDEDLIWSQYSNDKTDIGIELMLVVRSIYKALPLEKKLKVLSIGSGSEPQFKILEAAFRGGVNLLDIDPIPLEIVRKHADQRGIENLSILQGDYTEKLRDSISAELFRKKELGNKRQDLVTLHHSLYYCKEAEWTQLFKSLYGEILAGKGAIHAVMMSSVSKDCTTSTWLYNHFAGKFFQCRNDQNLKTFGNKLKESKDLLNSEVFVKTHKVKFWIDDFEKYMSVVWMILLYPIVHKYNSAQKEEITEYIYSSFWVKRIPLIQTQDHLVIKRNLGK